MGTSWTLLLIAGLFEIVFAACLKLSDGFRKKGWTAMFILAAAISFLLLARAIETIPLGTAYAVWTGIGAAAPPSSACSFSRSRPRSSASFSSSS